METVGSVRFRVREKTSRLDSRSVIPSALLPPSPCLYPCYSPCRSCFPASGQGDGAAAAASSRPNRGKHEVRRSRDQRGSSSGHTRKGRRSRDGRRSGAKEVGEEHGAEEEAEGRRVREAPHVGRAVHRDGVGAGRVVLRDDRGEAGKAGGAEAGAAAEGPRSLRTRRRTRRTRLVLPRSPDGRGEAAGEAEGGEEGRKGRDGDRLRDGGAAEAAGDEDGGDADAGSGEEGGKGTGVDDREVQEGMGKDPPCPACPLGAWVEQASKGALWAPCHRRRRHRHRRRRRARPKSLRRRPSRRWVRRARSRLRPRRKRSPSQREGGLVRGGSSALGKDPFGAPRATPTSWQSRRRQPWTRGRWEGVHTIRRLRRRQRLRGSADPCRERRRRQCRPSWRPRRGRPRPRATKARGGRSSSTSA